MASRLSENSIKASYDAGHAGVAWTPPKANENLMLVDFEGLLAKEDPRGAVQQLPPQLVYHALKVSGADTVADIVPLLSTDQITRILDYDAWRDNDLAPERMLQWIRHFKANGPDGMADKFRDLDEEYQIALIRRYLKAYDKEEIEKLPDEVRDNLFPLPGEQIFYQIDSADREVVDSVQDLMQSALALDVGYALNILAYATWAVPNENEDMLRQFREARLEEDGFVLYEESLKAFAPIDTERLVSQWQSKKGATALASATDKKQSFFDQVIVFGMNQDLWQDTDSIDLQQKILHLANSVCSAAKVEPDDIIGLNRILEQIKALVSLGLDHVSGGDVALGLEIIKAETPKVLFRAGLTLVYQLQTQTLSDLYKAGVETEKLESLCKQQKWGQILWYLDTEYRTILGFQNTEILKALFNRFPMAPYLDNSQEAARIRFKPIDSVVALNSLRTEIQKISKEQAGKH